MGGIWCVLVLEQAFKSPAAPATTYMHAVTEVDNESMCTKRLDCAARDADKREHMSQDVEECVVMVVSNKHGVLCESRLQLAGQKVGGRSLSTGLRVISCTTRYQTQPTPGLYILQVAVKQPAGGASSVGWQHVPIWHK